MILKTTWMNPDVLLLCKDNGYAAHYKSKREAAAILQGRGFSRGSILKESAGWYCLVPADGITDKCEWEVV